MSIRLILALAGLAMTAPAHAAAPPARLRVVGELFALRLADGRTLGSRDLVGAELSTPEGTRFRIDAVEPSKEDPSVLLHSFSIFDARAKQWTPACDADAYGRTAGFPVAGRIDSRGRYIKDAGKWYLTCTSGAQGKCILWGYDPWKKGPHGEDLTPFYRACQFTVRANYAGTGEAHTRNGTSVDVSDILGIQTWDSQGDASYAFEAGWGPAGAVCVARTRWPDLLSMQALLARAPKLGGPCDRATARARGALIFTRVMTKPVVHNNN